jgi:hypothetical protein
MVDITGSNLPYAGGGGGGNDNNLQSRILGGTEGSGAGGRYTASDKDASPNVGCGGGGTSYDGGWSRGGNGGSGIVIIRTLATASATTGSPTVDSDGLGYNVYSYTGSGSITF